MHKHLLAAALVLGAFAAPVGMDPRTAIAGTAVKLELEELVERAEIVLEGRVTALEAGLDERGRIETRYTISVDRTFLGEHRAVRHVRMPGGVLPDGRGLVLPGLPVLAVGEETILFLTREGSTGLRLPVGLAQGRFRIVRTALGSKRLLRDLSGLDLAAPDGRSTAAPSVHAMFDHSALTARIEAAVSARAARAAPVRDALRGDRR